MSNDIHWNIAHSDSKNQETIYMANNWVIVK